MNVLFLIDTLHVGGAERSLLAVAPRLQGVHPVICQLHPGGCLADSFRERGVELHQLHLLQRRHFAKAVVRVLAIMQERSIQLLHASLYEASIVARLAATVSDVPVIDSFVSDSYATLRTQQMSSVRRFKHQCVQALDWATAPLCQRVIANSEAVRAANCRALGFPTDRVEVVCRGRDPSEFAVSSRAAARQELGLSGEAPLVLTVARLEDGKGHLELVRAVAHLAEWNKLPSDAQVWFAGEGPCRATIEAEISKLELGDCIRLLGSRRDVPRLLAACDVFAFPSHYEGLPGAVVEAMLSGAPIVGSDTPVHREILADGRTGLLARLKDPVDLAAKTARLLDDRDLARRLGDAARREAIERFDVDRVAQRYVEIYRQVVDEHRAGVGRPQGLRAGVARTLARAWARLHGLGPRYTTPSTGERLSEGSSGRS